MKPETLEQALRRERITSIVGYVLAFIAGFLVGQFLL